MSAWYVTTTFGSAAALFPLSLAIAIWLACMRAWRAAVLWLVMIGCGSLIVALTKAAFIGWGIGIRSIDFTGVSGHTMLSAAIYPVTAYVILATSSRPWRVAGVLAGIGLGVLIGVSRLIVHAHSTSEVIAGCALGTVIALGYLALARVPNTSRLHPAWAGTCAIALLLSLHQERLPTQHWIIRVSLQLSGHERPFNRVKWLKEKAPLRASSPTSQHSASASQTSPV